MKNVFIAIIVASLGATFAVTDLQGAKESKKTNEPAKGEHFDGSGTVKRLEADVCMVTGLHYWLHPSKGADVRLKPESKRDSQVLDRAAKASSKVHVTGTWDEAVECHYVKVSKAAEVK
ncbi:MAG TPA: hypothetical protein VE758_00405 [Chthoniobacterales bacterium]|jgi:hypothetical protein|nr:hypothetical protein [Chthoniobacterales bacterium]